MGRTDHSAVYFSHSMWVFGGSDDESNKLKDLWEYKVQAEEWRQIQPREGKEENWPKVRGQLTSRNGAATLLC